jgi:hypothetical protein
VPPRVSLRVHPGGCTGRLQTRSPGAERDHPRRPSSSIAAEFGGGGRDLHPSFGPLRQKEDLGCASRQPGRLDDGADEDRPRCQPCPG